MPEEKAEERKASWLTPALFVAVLALGTGGLGGAILTLWWNHKPPLRLGYVVTTTTTGADPAVRTLVPNLSMKIGDRDVRAIHIHTVEISATSGTADEVRVSVSFPKAPEAYGALYSAPTPLHKAACEYIGVGVKCGLGPIDGRGVYRIILANSDPGPPQVDAAGAVELVPLNEAAARQGWFTTGEALIALMSSLVAAMAIGLYAFTSSGSRRLEMILLQQREEARRLVAEAERQLRQAERHKEPPVS